MLNVPADKISALPDKPDHFLNWLRKNYDAQIELMTYAPRAVFGRYVNSIIEPLNLEQVLASVQIECSQP